MSDLNQCTFTGRLGADPEIRATQKGSRVAKFRLACSETWKNPDGEKQERTEWVSVVAWGEGLVSFCERFLRKGNRVIVQGSMQSRTWQDQSGKDRYKTEIIVQGFNGFVKPIDWPDNDNNTGSSSPSSYSEQGMDDNVPF